VGTSPSVYVGAAFGEHLFTIKNIAFTRILLDQGICVTMMVFAAAPSDKCQNAISSSGHDHFDDAGEPHLNQHRQMPIPQAAYATWQAENRSRD
jgi:hypothetical protein